MFYIFLRGHNEPGGGFIAGLIVSIACGHAIYGQRVLLGLRAAALPLSRVIGAGVLIAGLTGIGSWFFGKPFLTSDFTYVRIPPFEKFELATAALFDLGVFLAVVGAVMLSLESFSRLARRAHVPDSEHPMDIDPSRDPADPVTPSWKGGCSMELLVASAIGILTAAGLYLVLRLRTFPVIMGISLLTYAVNVFLFASGRLTVARRRSCGWRNDYTDPLPQALVLTAIVISFGMTAVVVMIAPWRVSGCG